MSALRRPRPWTREPCTAADRFARSLPVVVAVDHAFEAGEFTTRISFRDDHTIAGLFILPAHTAA